MKRTVLVADDDSDLLKLLSAMLGQEGFRVLTANNGESAVNKIRMEKPHLVVLDVRMPRMSGLEVCKVLKLDEQTRHIPIIMLTGKSEEIDRVLGLELGADDYITKPFSVRELILRINMILKRAYGNNSKFDPFKYGILSLDHSRHEVKVKGKLVGLTLTEFKILSSLTQCSGQVKTRDALLDEILGYRDGVFSRTVDTHIQRLRTKLGPAGAYIKTIRGLGYLFNE